MMMGCVMTDALDHLEKSEVTQGNAILNTLLVRLVHQQLLLLWRLRKERLDQKAQFQLLMVLI